MVVVCFSEVPDEDRKAKHKHSLSQGDASEVVDVSISLCCFGTAAKAVFADSQSWNL